MAEWTILVTAYIAKGAEFSRIRSRDSCPRSAAAPVATVTAGVPTAAVTATATRGPAK